MKDFEKKFKVRYLPSIRGFSYVKTQVLWIDERMGYGLFADQNIKKGEWVGEYTGEVTNVSEGEYTLGVSRKTFIDASKMGNETRFINHSYTPNLEQVSFEKDQIHVIFRASRDIKKGEQLFFDYGEQYWRNRTPPYD